MNALKFTAYLSYWSCKQIAAKIDEEEFKILAIPVANTDIRIASARKDKLNMTQPHCQKREKLQV